MDYKEYTVEDFASDEFFVRWVKSSDDDASLFWTKWLLANPEKKKHILQARQLVESVKYKKRVQLDDKMYVEIFEEIKKSHDRTIKPDNPFLSRFGKKWFKPLAATILLAVLVQSLYSWLYFENALEDNADKTLATQVEWLMKEVPFGQRTTLKLSDETTVKLNSGSKLRFPKSFERDSIRNVILEGEAYFDVAHDPKKPFIISTKDVQIRVLGTSFNINIDDDETKVALVDGKLKVETNTGKNMLLAPKEMATFNTSNHNNHLVKSTFIADEVIGWKDGLLQFQKADFLEVISILERWYGVNFTILPDVNINGKYSGQYDNRPLKEVLEGIAIAYHIDFVMKGKNIIIHSVK